MGKFIDNLALLFIGLKLAGYIDWSWWLVLSPLWLAMVAAFVVHFPPKYREAKARRLWNQRKKQKAERDGSE